MKPPAMPKSAAQKGTSKPSIRLRKVKLAGRSAFPPQGGAFGPSDASAAPAFAPGAPVPAGGGDTGA